MRKITEEWALQAEAGDELDRICALWFGCIMREDPSYETGELWTQPNGAWNVVPPRYSSSWSDAGPLLEAMGDSLSREEEKDGGSWYCVVVHDKLVCGESYPQSADWRAAVADTPQLAIARACAVLVAHGITKEDMRETYRDG